MMDGNTKQMGIYAGGSEMSTQQTLAWKIHTPNLLLEIGSGQDILRIPITILQNLLGQVVQRAIELDDPKLNLLMCRLTLYESADPSSKDYDPEVFDKLEKQIAEGLNQ